MSSKSRGSKVTVKCKHCEQEFQARVADRKRGWAKFCSKSCKALYQEMRTGKMKAYLRRKQAKSKDSSKSINVLSFSDEDLGWAEDYHDKNG